MTIFVFISRSWSLGSQPAYFFTSRSYSEACITLPPVGSISVKSRLLAPPKMGLVILVVPDNASRRLVGYGQMGKSLDANDEVKSQPKQSAFSREAEVNCESSRLSQTMYM